MKTNEGSLDRALRVILGVVLIALAYFGVVGGTWATVAYVVGAVAAATGLVGFCALYAILGINTKK